MTTQRDDRQTVEGGASVFNPRGQRLNEFDLNERRHGKTIDEMTLDDWRQAAAVLLDFDACVR